MYRGPGGRTRGPGRLGWPAGARAVGGSAALPAWATGHVVGEWFAISGTTHSGSAADPGSTNQARLAFSGGGIADAGTFVLPATGGHTDYSGNEVTSIGLLTNVPVWAQNKAGSTPTANAAYYGDGTPSARHTNWGTLWSSTYNRMVLHYTRTAYGGSAASFPDSNRFNLGTNAWDGGSGSWANAPNAPGCRDTSDNVWASTGDKHGILKWTAATDTWTSSGSPLNVNGSATYAYPFAFDSSRNKVFGLANNNGEGGTGVSAWQFDASSASAITFNSSSAFTQFQTDSDAYAGMVYHAKTDKFYWYAGVTGHTQRVYVITPNAGTTWDMAILSVTGSTPPAVAGSGIFNRFFLLPTTDILVAMLTCDDPLYALRLA